MCVVQNCHNSFLSIDQASLCDVVDHNIIHKKLLFGTVHYYFQGSLGLNATTTLNNYACILWLISGCAWQYCRKICQISAYLFDHAHFVWPWHFHFAENSSCWSTRGCYFFVLVSSEDTMSLKMRGLLFVVGATHGLIEGIKNRKQAALVCAY